MKKSIWLALLAMLFLFANSCHDEIVQESDLTLKSGKLKKDVAAEMKSWFDSNPDVNKFVLLDYANEVKWASAHVMEIDNSIVVEVSVKLKGKYKVMSQKEPLLNFDHRLLFIKERGVITSYMEYLSSKKDLCYLQDTEKASYLKRDGSFEGTIVLENSQNELSTIYHSTGSSKELRLKNVEEVCYELVEIFSDGSYVRISGWGCNPGGGDGAPKDPTTPTPPSGSAGGRTTNDPTPVPAIIEDPSFVGTNADCVKSKLESGSVINCLLNGFSLSTSTIDLTFKVADISDNGTCSYNRDTKRMTITIDSDRLTGSSMELARTELHESFHAYLYGKLYDPKYTSDLLPEPNFVNDFNKYCSNNQHNYIADNYISYMKSALGTYFNSETYKDSFLGTVNGNQYWHGTDWLFECLAWGGLKGTDAWSAFQSDPEKKRKYDETMNFIANLLPKENCGK